MSQGTLPSLDDVRALLGVGLAALLLTLCGRALVGRHMTAEMCLVAGWGAVCCVLTVWAVATPFSLYGALFMIAPLAVLGVLRWPAVSDGSWRLAVLTVPLWLVLAAARPAQIDTWFNLVPNLAYVVDHARLPTADGALSYSFLPVAPYNTQFVTFLASTLTGGLTPCGIGLFNVLLQCAAGLLLARVLSGTEWGDRPAALQWWACAAGLLLAMPLNPGFLPKVFVSSYGEAPLAVATMFAVWLSARLFDRARSRGPVGAPLAALAFVLMALVNIKQSSIGLVVPLLCTLFCVGLLCPAMGVRRWAGLVAAAGLPSLMLFAVWRWFVVHDFPGGELTVLPPSHWHIQMLPRILRGMLVAMVKAPACVAAILAVLVASWLEARRRPWQPAAIVLALVSGMTLLFNLFLLFTYVSHFPTDWAAGAHSYRRYLSQVSLSVVLGLTIWLRPWIASRARLSSRTNIRAAQLTLLVATLWPFAMVRPLRADLSAPQPFVWDMAHKFGRFLGPDDRLGLILPGDDDDALGSMIRGVLLFTQPRHPALDFTVERVADDAALAELAARGATRALVSCAPPGGLAGLPADAAGVLGFEDGAWRPLAVFPYPDHFNDQYFAAWLPHAPLCGHDAFARAQIFHACRADYPPRISELPPPARRPCVRFEPSAGLAPSGTTAAQ